MKIQVFGDKAKEIKLGQLFMAQKSSVEGREVVTLEAVEIKNVKIEKICKEHQVKDCEDCEPFPDTVFTAVLVCDQK